MVDVGAGIGWSGIGWSGIGWYGIGWYGIGWYGIELNFDSRDAVLEVLTQTVRQTSNGWSANAEA